ncbi:MAG: cohesin domain-containing protein, partial [Candidatus Desantisbacteria bacterium]
RDLILLGGAFGSTPADTNWNSLSDFNKEAESRDRIDARDLSALASRFGRSSLFSASKSPSIEPDIAYPASIRLASDVSQVSAGQEFTIKALIEDAANLYSCGFDLVFDADKFEVIAVKEGNFLKQDSVNTSFMSAIKQGRIIIGASRLEEVGGISGSGILAEVRLRAREDAGIKFTLQKVSIEDSNLRLMGAEAVNLDYTQQTIQPNLKVFCYPNPAKDRVTFTFDLPKHGEVDVKIYNIAGELVKQIEKKGLTQGSQELIWQSIETASGIYIYKFVAKYDDGGEDKTIGRLGIVK